MPSYYSVIRFLPDPIAEEFINVGTVVGDDDGAIVSLVQDMRRAVAFSRYTGVVIDFVELFKHWNTQAKAGMTKTELLAIANNWHNSIQLTEPRASLKSKEDLQKEVNAAFLKTDPSPEHFPVVQVTLVLADTQEMYYATFGEFSDVLDMMKHYKSTHCIVYYDPDKSDKEHPVTIVMREIPQSQPVEG